MRIISPTHKRTEGRAPVWGSELTTIQGEFDFSEGPTLKAS